MDFDRADRRILDVLQRNARVSNQELAEQVGLSAAPCWRRVRRLEESGVVASYAALLDPGSVGLSITAYALVSLDNHHPANVRAFDAFIADRPEVLECYSMTGQNDYLVKIVAPSIAAYDEFLSAHLLPIPGVRAVNSSIVLKRKKFTTALPIP
jgi:Lrp/AsnC family transcriptional regulator, leucine-responsive regulatory protein